MENIEVEVLLVEDNPSDAELTIRALKKNNLANKVHHVKDGDEALDFIFACGNYANRKIENAPKVILLDLKMPKVNGIEVLKVLNTDKHLLILNAYSLGFSSIIIENFLRSYAKQHQSDLQTGELFLQAKSGVKLPLGVWGRLTK